MKKIDETLFLVTRIKSNLDDMQNHDEINIQAAADLDELIDSLKNVLNEMKTEAEQEGTQDGTV